MADGLNKAGWSILIFIMAAIASIGALAFWVVVEVVQWLTSK